MQRSQERLKAHYNLEKRLAQKLMSSSKEERKELYSSCYNELFQEIHDHPQLTDKADPTERLHTIQLQLEMIKQICPKGKRFMELGPGDCALSFEATKSYDTVYAIDVSDEITKQENLPSNFHLIISDGATIELPEESIDIAFSDQLMEHIHPDDALQQVANIYRSLSSEGIYICSTPNRLSGPHDISQYFDNVATGFHLKEYTHKEMHHLFKEIGFRRFSSFIHFRGNVISLPKWMFFALESVISKVPHAIRKKIFLNKITNKILGIQIMAWK